MFSRTTTASSMRMPITSEIAIRVIMFSVKPAAHMKKNVAITDVGSASAVISVDRQSRMNTNTISTAMMPPKTMFRRTSSRLERMKRASSWIGRMVRSGNAATFFASTALMRSVMATVLPPACFRTANDTASTPLRRVVDVRSS